MNRRQFIKLVGATGALAATGSTACERGPVQRLIPYVIPPDDIIPGIPVWYTTVCRECSAGCGMLVRTREGRAVKAEGNPRHPINRGALCARGQASLQALYNPDRYMEPLKRSGELENTVSWNDALGIIAGVISDPGRSGEVVFLTGRQGPGVIRLMKEWLGSVEGVSWLQYEPFENESLKKACQILFQKRTKPIFLLRDAEYILSLGADFLGTWNSPVEHSRDYSEFRSRGTGKHVQIEPRRSLTGANADEWIPVKPGTEPLIALSLLHIILKRGWNAALPGGELERLKKYAEPYAPVELPDDIGIGREKLHELARNFSGARPGIVVSGGEFTAGHNSTLLESAVLLLNYAAGYVGRTVIYTGPDGASLSSYRDLLGLTREMEEGRIELLLVSGVNPVFFLPESAGFVNALDGVKTLVSHHESENETSYLSDLILPSAHSLERWDDWSCAYGRSVIQPVMKPLSNSKGFGDLIIALDRLTGKAADSDSFYTFIRKVWEEEYADEISGDSFEVFWAQVLREGGVFSEPEHHVVRLSDTFEEDIPGYTEEDERGAQYHLVLYPSIFHYDGSGANKPWLQEAPDPITQLVWDSWAEMREEEVSRMGLEEGDIIKLTSRHGNIELPVHINQGVAGRTIAVCFGQGHSHYGRYASGVGERAGRLLAGKPEPHSGALPFSPMPIHCESTGRRRKLVSVQGGSDDLDRGILGPKGHGTHKDMYPPHPHPDYRWAMAIDLNLCTGCGACVVSCYAENNIPVVGKKLVSQGREMSWIRIERYYDDDNDVHFLPMMCQQCDYAPCEPVCPVHATYHNPEGLNAQIYNRCVGTRYCANNCPYKVRRFNWFTFSWPEPLNWQLNPDLSVREKGVMEKCTFCVQRIREAEDKAKDEERPVGDGEVIPACAQTCPTGAIVFGNLKDPESRVSKMASSENSYRVLEVLNTKPAVYYIRKTKPERGHS
ncbi:MAG: 4Fe-4S dicluster domain-containing protein [Candidatus Glassbacteria bacterium]